MGGGDVGGDEGATVYGTVEAGGRAAVGGGWKGTIISGIHETVSDLSQEEWVDRVEWMKRAKTG